MKVIDLLNKIAKGETPQKIRHWGTTYIFDEYRGDWGYVDKSIQPYRWFFKEFNCDLEKDLNSEVEIIEEEKKIEKFITDCCIHDIKGAEHNINLLKDKVDELIDAVNELKRDK